MIACRNLCAGYGSRAVLREVNFAAGAGEFVVLLGPNGGGKTTFLRALGGILPPSKGHIYLGGEALMRLHPRERARRVAVVPQRVEALPALSVHEMVLLGRYPYLSWLGGYKAEDYAAASAALEEAGAAELTQRQVRELSGGELQRVLLARALAQDTPVFLLDELAAGLDMARMIELFDVLAKRCHAGSLVITVMHDVNLAALYATRVMGLKQGRLLFDGPTEDVFTEDNLCELYETPIHVFRHPVLPVPQACPGRAAGLPSAVGAASGGASGVARDHGAGGGEDHR